MRERNRESGWNKVPGFAHLLDETRTVELIRWSVFTPILGIKINR